MYPVFIYTLNCPTTGIQRYCGQTINPDKRLRRHIIAARKETYHCPCWINSLLKKNLRPIMEIIDVVPDTEADFWEREYIQNFRERGFDLANICSGGARGFTRGKPSWNKGKPGPPSPMKGKKFPPEVCAKMSAAQTGKKRSPEAIAKGAAKARGRKHSPQACAKVSAAQKGKKESPATCAAISARQLGKKQSPETIARRVATRKLTREKKKI